MLSLLRVFAVALTLCAFGQGAIAQSAAKRSLTQVAGDVYRAQSNFHYALVVFTDAGTVVVDPINATAAAWLRLELQKRGAKPVSHLIYSHSHLDHASGGKVFADTATVIAHANAPAAIDGVAPDIRFNDKMQLTVGNKTFELSWLGEGHGRDLIAVVVRPENVGFIVDAASPKRLPYRDMPRSNVDGWINQVKAVEALDFKIFAPGHGKVGVKADAGDVRSYMQALRAQVLAGLKAGKSVPDLQQELTLEDYKDWQQYKQWRPLNIAGMARFLKSTGQVK